MNRIENGDVETPKTDRLIEDMMDHHGVPACPEWDTMVAHAREMERVAHAYRALAIAGMKVVPNG